MTTYKKAPVAEALLQLQFADQLSEKDMQRVARKAEGNYQNNDVMADFNVEVKVANGSAHPGLVGRQNWHRLTTSDGADVLVIYRNKITVSRMAPYVSWDAFFSRFTRDYDLFKSVVGYKRIERVGVRYINRIDIPEKDQKSFDISDYVNIYASAPNFPPSKVALGQVRLETTDEKSGATLLITAGNSDPVLINHYSYVLDIDVILFNDIPVKREDLLEKLAGLRHIKNNIFEALITDKSRELFNA